MASGNSGRQSDSSIEDLPLVTLGEGERVLGTVMFNWTKWFRWLLLAVILAGVGAVSLLLALGPVDDEVSALLFMAGIPALVAALLIFVLVYFAKRRSGAVLTNRRLVVSVAVWLLHHATIETRIVDIRGLVTYQTTFDRLFGKGALRVESSGTDISLHVSGFDDLADEIRSQQNRLREGDIGPTGAPSAGQTGPTTPGTPGPASGTTGPTAEAGAEPGQAPASPSSPESTTGTTGGPVSESSASSGHRENDRTSRDRPTGGDRKGSSEQQGDEETTPRTTDDHTTTRDDDQADETGDGDSMDDSNQSVEAEPDETTDQTDDDERNPSANSRGEEHEE